MRTLTSLLVLSLVACGGSAAETKPPTAPVASTATPEMASAPPVAAPDTVLVIEETTFTTGASSLKLRANGDLEGPDGKVKAHLGTDGKLVDASGKLVASIDAAGKITFASAGADEITIDQDGTVHTGAKAVKLGDDGTIEGDKTGTKVVVASAAGKRAAMFVMVLLVTRKQ
jgi:hypothetical protein